MTDGREAKDKLAQSADLLEQERLLTTRFLRRANHDLKGPARRLYMLGTMLQDPALPESERGEIRDLLVDAADNLRHIVEGFSVLHRARVRELSLAPCESRACAQQALEGRAITALGVEGLPVVLANKKALSEIFAEAIDNAALWAGRAEDLVLRFEAEEAPGGWVLGVEDNGPGLPDPEHLERAMLPFERLTLEGAERPGLGLSVVSTLAEKMGGRAWIEQGPGLRLRIWLPRPRG